MGLRELAERDLGGILEDDRQGFGWSITLIDPADVRTPFVGFSNDISQVIDPSTGELVAGRLATIALRLSSLYACGLDIPHGVAERNAKPWRVEVDDINGRALMFAVRHAMPDRALGLVTCSLAVYTV